jgi:DNA-binding ferritin-like protein
MAQTHFPLFVLIASGFALTLQGRAEEVTTFTFSTYVQAERIRACGDSPSSCHEDFDKLALIAERLDANEKVAEAFEKSGDKEKALEVRRQITSSAVMLDSLLDLLITLHKKGAQ